MSRRSRLDKGRFCSYVVCTVKEKKAAKQSAGKKRKDDVVRMRIPADQKQALIEAADREGLELSAWLRQLALRAAGVLPALDRKRKN